MTDLRLIARVTDAVVAMPGVDPEQVRVLLYELPPKHWAVGGHMKAVQQSAFAQRKEVGE
jgi:4-oxalocrotonate tautomerase